MSYSASIQGLGLLPGNSALVEMSMPVEVVNGLFWVKASDRAGIKSTLEATTTFLPNRGGSTWGGAYRNDVAGFSDPNWIDAAVQAGRAVAIAPGNFAAASVRVLRTDNADDLAEEVSALRGGRFAILAAPDALVQAAVALAAASPGDSGGGDSGATLPKWLVPAVIGSAVVATVALVKSFMKA